MEDFRSLAKKFVPENVADELISLATKPALRERIKVANSEDLRDNPAASQADEETSFQRHKHNNKELKNGRASKPLTKYDIELDELVARVKESLQNDWSLFYPSKFKPKRIKDSNDNDFVTTDYTTHRKKVTYDSDSYTTEYKDATRKPQVRYIKQSREKVKNKQQENERNVDEARYIESQTENNYAPEAEAQPLKYNIDTERQVFSQPTRFKKTSSRQEVKKPRIVKDNVPSERLVNRPRYINKKIATQTTADPADLLKETDIRDLKDSYEDYVTPKRDEDNNYEQQGSAKYNTKKKDSKSNVNKKISDIFTEVHKNLNDNYYKLIHNGKQSSVLHEVDKSVNSNYKKRPDANEHERENNMYKKPDDNDDDTVNYNKKKRNERNTDRKESKPLNDYTTEPDDDRYEPTSETPTSRQCTDAPEYDNNNQQAYSNKQTHGRYEKPSRNKYEDRKKDRDAGNGPERLLEVHEGFNSEIVPAPSSMYLDRERKVPSQSQDYVPQRDKKQTDLKDKIRNDRHLNRQKHNNKNKNTDPRMGTEDPKHPFKGYDLSRIKDSYEDYVTPKRDDNMYEEADEPKYSQKQETRLDRLRERESSNFNNHGKKKYVEEKQYYNKPDKVIDDYETTNYNKKGKNAKHNIHRSVNNDRNTQRKQYKEPRVASAILPLPTDPILTFDQPGAYMQQMNEARNIEDEFQRSNKEAKMRAESFLLEQQIKEGF